MVRPRMLYQRFCALQINEVSTQSKPCVQRGTMHRMCFLEAEVEANGNAELKWRQVPLVAF